MSNRSMSNRSKVNTAKNAIICIKNKIIFFFTFPFQVIALAVLYNIVTS